MKKHYRAIIIAISAVAIAASAAIVAVTLHRTAAVGAHYRRVVTNTYSHALTELTTSVAKLDYALQKCVIAGTSGMECLTSAEAYSASVAAKLALGELPQSAGEFENTSSFLTQAGDFAFALMKKTARGELLNDEELAALIGLSETAGVLSGNLTGLVADLSAGDMTLVELSELTRETVRRGESATRGEFSSRIKSAEDEFPELPTLIYDGPFSSHIASMKPRLTENEDEITQSDALERAADFLGIDGSALTRDGERGGNLPVYLFSAQRNGDEVSVEISKRGGYVVNMYSSRSTRDGEEFDADKAAAIAEKFLQERGYTSMRETYRMIADGALTVNYAYECDGVICYTDLIKVAVFQGDVVGFEAQGYVMHHHERRIPEPQISETDAAAKISPRLKILSTALAIIPTDGRNEVFCREFKCENEQGKHFIAYINAENGCEERILMLIEDENGTLAL